MSDQTLQKKPNHIKYWGFILLFFWGVLSNAQYILVPDRVFDGEEIHSDWIVAVNENKIVYAGPETGLKRVNAYQRKELKGMTLLPGIIEGHSHILLHPYNETEWNDQVLKESSAERAVRATVHAKKSLMAGVTTMRDLGSEGAGYTDVYIKKTIDDGIIPGPRLLVAGPAIVATGAYGPKGFHEGVTVPLGAIPVSGEAEAIKEVRNQMGGGANLIKIYADYRWGKDEPSQATFLQKEIDAMVAAATTAGRYVVAHASTPEGMKRATLGGVETIEHGDGGTLEIFKLMKEHNVALCPTLAAGDAIEQYKGWLKGKGSDPDRIVQKKKSFKLALESGVDIAFGGDVGVFTHGENYREMELMVSYGMQPLNVLQSATSVNARIFHLNDLGRIQPEFKADIIAVEGNPIENIAQMRKVKFVMKDGVIYKDE
ncbi:metal-dependent hydrolase family protein [Flagellimonas marina]|uniref:Amidohydrolase family protein n=1 Tax=Flagellimonas marina TaxID=1775168 RepID=A0ABV8PL20_9FLAO